jgi:hypothetical protein
MLLHKVQEEPPTLVTACPEGLFVMAFEGGQVSSRLTAIFFSLFPAVKNYSRHFANFVDCCLQDVPEYRCNHFFNFIFIQQLPDSPRKYFFVFSPTATRLLAHAFFKQVFFVFSFYPFLVPTTHPPHVLALVRSPSAFRRG